MASSRGRTRGKMEYLEPIAPSHQIAITLIISKLRIRSVPSHIFLPLHSTKQQGGLGRSMFTKDLGSRFLFRTLMEISLFSSVTGTRLTTRWGIHRSLGYWVLYFFLPVLEETLLPLWFCVKLFNLQTLQRFLDSGRSLPSPDGVLINGQAHSTFSGDQGHSPNSASWGFSQ